MTEQVKDENGSEWRRFIRKHRAVFVVFVVAAILAVIGAVYVFVWFTASALASGLVPVFLGMWSMNNLVIFILNAVFWELVLIGIPIAIAAVIGWQWWKRLPEEEKKEHLFRNRNRSSNAGGGFSLLLFIAFAIKVYIDGNWYSAISTWRVDYVVLSFVTILIWIAAIIAIPAIIGVVWWIHHETNKKP